MSQPHYGNPDSENLGQIKQLFYNLNDRERLMFYQFLQKEANILKQKSVEQRIELFNKIRTEVPGFPEDFLIKNILGGE